MRFRRVIICGLVAGHVGVAAAEDEEAANPHDAAHCTVERAVLTCRVRRERARDYLAALAAPSTERALRRTLADTTILGGGAARERYRRSVERVRRAARRHAILISKRRRRGKVDDETYNAMKRRWHAALANYALAMRVHNEALWRDPEPPPGDG